MDIIIDKKLKELRHKKGNRQEDLAVYLGISVQAVSKWERGEGMPDITLLPGIAAFYGVSVDTLLGIDEEEKNKRIKEITDEYNRIRRTAPREDGSLVVEHNIDEGMSLIRQGLRKFPGCWFFMQLLASDLWWKGKLTEGDERSEYFNEAMELCEKILYECTEDRWRHCASSILCMIYNDSGRKEKSLELACQSPGFVDSMDWKLAKIYEGKELTKQLERNIRELTRLLYLSVQEYQKNGEAFVCDHTMKYQFEIIEECLDS